MTERTNRKHGKPMKVASVSSPAQKANEANETMKQLRERKRHSASSVKATRVKLRVNPHDHLLYEAYIREEKSPAHHRPDLEGKTRPLSLTPEKDKLYRIYYRSEYSWGQGDDWDAQIWDSEDPEGAGTGEIYLGVVSAEEIARGLSVEEYLEELNDPRTIEELTQDQIYDYVRMDALGDPAELTPYEAKRLVRESRQKRAEQIREHREKTLKERTQAISLPVAPITLKTPESAPSPQEYGESGLIDYSAVESPGSPEEASPEDSNRSLFF